MATKQNQIATALQRFYQKPVAMVSIELLLSIGLVLLLGVFAIQPTLMTMSELTKEIADKEDLYNQYEKKLDALNTAQELYASVQNELPLLDEAIPSQPELIRSVKMLELLAGENSVIITGFSSAYIPDEVTADVSAVQTSIPVSVSVVGDYPSIRNYVTALRGSRRLFTVQTVSFSLEENRGDKKLAASILLNLPYFGQPVIIEKK